MSEPRSDLRSSLLAGAAIVGLLALALIYAVFMQSLGFDMRSTPGDIP